jgi:A/G-specific adenine glycosylase
MHKAAKMLVDEFDSEFPQSVEGVCELPGIGRSTAAAILSISRCVQAAILDGNVKRVLSRFHAVPTWPGEKKTENAMWELAENYMPSERCGDYTQAMMDLGATLCTRSKPQCLLCPLESDCEGRQTPDPAQFPIRNPKKAAKPEKSIQLLVLMNQQEQLLQEKRQQTGIWGGLWSLPELATDESVLLHIEQRFNAQVSSVIPLSSFRHTFSHYHLDISPSQIQMTADNWIMEGDKYQWFSQQEALALGLPAPVRSILEKII